VRGIFFLCNVNIVGFTIYLIATCFGHMTIFKQTYFAEFYSTDNGSIVFFFRILDIIVNDYSDRFNVSRLLIHMVAILSMEPSLS
jgi:hypothetical protein